MKYIFKMIEEKRRDVVGNGREKDRRNIVAGINKTVELCTKLKLFWCLIHTASL